MKIFTTASGKVYAHVIDLSTDATHIKDEDGKIVFTVDSSGNATDASGKIIGRFRIIYPFKSGLLKHIPRWKFVPEPEGTERMTGEREIIEAEAIVFKEMLEAKGN